MKDEPTEPMLWGRGPGLSEGIRIEHSEVKTLGF